MLKQQGPWTVGALANQLWSVGSASNVEREDEVADSLPLEEVLANAPNVEDGWLRVRAVLE